jgi:hypothetical protein
MQIIQFLVGASYAGAHSFISYSIPVQVTSFSSSPTTSTIASTTTAVSTGIGALAKKFLRAVAEGVAENIIGVNAPQAQPPTRESAPTYRTEYKTISCVDTSGQTFAIWFNVLYLAPLTWLFVRFFIRSYLRRTGAGTKGRAGEKRPGMAAAAGKARFDALKGVGKEVEKGTNGNAMNGHGHKSAEMNGNGKVY